MCCGEPVAGPPQPAPDPLLPDWSTNRIRDLQGKTVPLDLHAEALGAADVDVVLRQIHAVASHVGAERLDGREHRGHARLVLDLGKELLADQEGLDAFLDDLRHASSLVSSDHACIVEIAVNHSALDGADERSRINLMSMVLINPSAPDRVHYTHLFARIVRDRRRELSLTVARAAELTGLTVSQWISIEAGWVPADHQQIRTISETLQVRTSELAFASVLSRCAQEEAVQ